MNDYNLLVLVLVLAAGAAAAAASGEEQRTAPPAPEAPKSSWEMQKDGDGKGRDVVVVAWKTRSGAAVGQVRIPVTGLGRLGPASFKLAAFDGSPCFAEWDTREWQWWKGYPFPPDKMRPREVAEAVGGAEGYPGGVRAWTRYLCDGVETTQEWLFPDLADGGEIAYDCLITVRNVGKEALEDYGQFFASYTAWNGNKGHLFWSSDGTLVNYRQKGSSHLDYYVAAKGSSFEKAGCVKGCPKGGGTVKATWKHPVSVSLAGPNDYRHVVLSEEARTSALAHGMQGTAQDYLIFPPEGRLAAGASFPVHVRHLLVKATDEELPKKLETWWDAFAKDHDRVHGSGRAAGKGETRCSDGLPPRQ